MASSTARARFPVQLSVSVDEATAERIREEAAERGVSLGEVVRDRLREEALVHFDARRVRALGGGDADVTTAMERGAMLMAAGANDTQARAAAQAIAAGALGADTIAALTGRPYATTLEHLGLTPQQ